MAAETGDDTAIGFEEMQAAATALPDGLSLEKRDGVLMLTDGERTLCGDFSRMEKRLHEANLRKELLVRAARIRAARPGDIPVVLDATAGLGEDSLLLAAAGSRVELYEKDPVIAALLADALHRAARLPELADVVSRMRLHREDSVETMRTWCAKGLPSPDIVYLDPMFPERQKSALVRKKFQLLQKLERPCTEEEELLQAAIDVKPFKILIKRPLKGPLLAGRKPSYSLTGKAVRYDCLVFPENLHRDETPRRSEEADV